MIKHIFGTAISLIFKPSDAWAELKEKQADDKESFLSDYIYPFIGVITFVVFVGMLFTSKEADVQIALKAAIMSLMSILGGFFLASYFVNEMWYKLFHRERDMKRCMCFVGYSSSLMFVLNILLSLLPAFFFFRIFILYTIYIVWEGAVPYMDVKESEQLKFVSLSTTIIILTPLAIEFILGLVMPGLKF